MENQTIYFTQKEAASILGLTQPAIHYRVKTGVFTYHEYIDEFGCRMKGIPAEQVLKFKKKPKNLTAEDREKILAEKIRLANESMNKSNN